MAVRSWGFLRPAKAILFRLHIFSGFRGSRSELIISFPPSRRVYRNRQTHQHWLCHDLQCPKVQGQFCLRHLFQRLAETHFLATFGPSRLKQFEAAPEYQPLVRQMLLMTKPHLLLSLQQCRRWHGSFDMKQNVANLHTKIDQCVKKTAPAILLSSAIHNVL